jgi:hypothetical protein
MSTERRATRFQTIVLLHAAALSMALSLTAGPIAAQTKPVVVKAAAGVSASALARADWYVARAEAFDVNQSAGGYNELARLYRTAAELRGSDTAAVTNYRLAAWAYVAAGDKIAALRVMTRAAELAEHFDAVERAVGSYIDAALIAYSGGRDREVATLVRQADTLLESRRLAPDRRVALRQRLENEPMLAAAMR